MGVQVAVRNRLAIVSEVVTKFYRTSELKGSSVDFQRRGSQDYIKARMIAAQTAIAGGHLQPWTELYAESARALCQAQAVYGKPNLTLAWEQFRYGRSAKSLLFYLAALCGKPGLKAWNLLVQMNRARQVGGQSAEDTPLL